jgi:hypothetical protein
LALRWKPQPSASELMSEAAPPAGSSAAAAEPDTTHGQLWLADADPIRPIKVHVGITNNSLTEISGPDLKPGMKVVIGDAVDSSSGSADAKSPFIPQLRGRRR